MLLLILCAVLVAGALTLIFWVRPSDLPPVEPVLPWQHLEDRKARIYENLRDLQFEYRVGKFSDEDYQRTKKSLQGELAVTLVEMDSLKAASAAAPVVKKHAKKLVCPHCNAQFDKYMKFCGECGKAMQP